MMGMYFVYILRCKDGSLYTGITTDVERRFAEHKSAKGGHYTAAKEAEEVLYVESAADCSDRAQTRSADQASAAGPRNST